MAAAPRVLATVTLAALLASTSGCSLLFVKPPPSPEEWSPLVHCTSSDALPIVDMLVTGAQMVRTVLALEATDADYAGATVPRDLDVILGVGAGAVFLVSSVIGFRSTSKCREVLANREEPDRPRPRARRPPPHLTVGPPPLVDRKREEAAEEAAVQARAAERARAQHAEAGAPSEVDAGVLPEAPAEVRPPPVRQRVDPE